jgi:hypothetical protein
VLHDESRRAALPLCEHACGIESPPRLRMKTGCKASTQAVVRTLPIHRGNMCVLVFSSLFLLMEKGGKNALLPPPSSSLSKSILDLPSRVAPQQHREEALSPRSATVMDKHRERKAMQRLLVRRFVDVSTCHYASHVGHIPAAAAPPPWTHQEMRRHPRCAAAALRVAVAETRQTPGS